MQENHLENLEKMFPRGYVIAYTCPDNQIRLSYFNPLKIAQIYDYAECLKENFMEKE